MEKKLFTNTHYNIPGHAHALTFSTYQKKNVFLDERACEMFLRELQGACEEFAFRLWAYVIMPNHVHLLIFPLKKIYAIDSINKAIKGRMAKQYIKFYRQNNSLDLLLEYRVIEKRVEMYRIWQQGGGFDRNLWNREAIHKTINYIEANPVRRNLAPSPELYQWSSAYARVNNIGVIPDLVDLPVAMSNT
jgi:putative transposase